MKTLIVEDDFASRLFLKKIADLFGEADTVINGLEAVSAFKLAWEDNSPYDIVFMDIMMPEMDGNEAIQMIRQYEKDIGVNELDQVTIVMTTAYGDPQNVFKAYKEGMVANYLTKPINKKDIMSIYNAIIEKRAQK